MSEKPHKGRIVQCTKSSEAGEYFYWCTFLDHPKFKDKFGHTSLVVSENGSEIETLNSRYTKV